MWAIVDCAHAGAAAGRLVAVTIVSGPRAMLQSRLPARCRPEGRWTVPHRTLALATAVIVLSFSAEPAGQIHATFRDPHSQQVFRAGRLQLGGEASIESLHAVVMKGLARTTDERGAPVVRDVEVRVLLPGHYLRIETADGYERRTGFAGRALLSEIRSGSSLERPPGDMTEGLVRAERSRLARLLLGSMLATSSDLWLSFRWAARSGEMSRDVIGTVSTIDTGAPPVLEVVARQFYSRLHLSNRFVPLRVDYEAGGQTAISIAFGDRRPVDGLLWPHRITTSRDGETIDDLFLDEIVVNPPLTEEDFVR